jgi:hypothetical protein
MTLPSQEHARSADEVRARNAELDAELRDLLGQVTQDALARDPGGRERTLAQLLATLAEAAQFLADDLDGWLDAGVEADRPPLGRPEEPADRFAEQEAAREADPGVLRGDVEFALSGLSAALDRLHDRHLPAEVERRGSGTQTLGEYLESEVLDLKATSAEQLRAALEAVTGGGG